VKTLAEGAVETVASATAKPDALAAEASSTSQTSGTTSTVVPTAAQQGPSFAQQLSNAQGTQTVRPATLPSAVDQVKLQIDKGAATGSNTISVILHPEELGRVEVKLEMGQDGQVKATVTADNAQTLQTLKNDSHSLQQSLQDAGLSADANSLNFQLRSDQQSAQQQQQQSGGDTSQGQTAQADTSLTDDSTDTGLTSAAALAAWNANSSDGLDIRV